MYWIVYFNVIIGWWAPLGGMTMIATLTWYLPIQFLRTLHMYLHSSSCPRAIALGREYSLPGQLYCDTLKMGQPWPLFVYFWSFQTNNAILTTNQ